MMAEIKWIKIVTDIFDDEKILLIETLPEADSIIVIWFKLLCLAGKQNNHGVFVMGNGIPYTDKMLATIFRRSEEIINTALQTFEQFGMIEVVENAITIPNWGKHQNLDKIESKKEYMKNYMRDYRSKQKALACGKTNSKSNSKSNVSSLDKIREEKEREKDIDIDIEEGMRGEKSKSAPKKPKHKYGEYKNVLLSDEDLDKLKNEFPNDWEERIERLSDYVASTGKVYKNHLATIRTWAKKDKDNPQQSSGYGKKESTRTWCTGNEPSAEEILGLV